MNFSELNQFLAYFFMLKGKKKRLNDCYETVLLRTSNFSFSAGF